jgi:mono/diheme cytochrome c family protein
MTRLRTTLKAIGLNTAAILAVFLCFPCGSWELAAAPEDSKKTTPVEQYRDVRGAIVFRTYCVLCHGPQADGRGRAARHYSPPPANLAASQATDEYKEKIIRKGGAAMGRSPFMPPWEQELTAEQIQDVVAYLRTINVNNRRTR